VRDLWTRIPDDTRAELDRVTETLERLVPPVAAAMDGCLQVERLVSYAAGVPASLDPVELDPISEEEDQALAERSGLLRLLDLAGEIEDAARGCFTRASVDAEPDDD